MKSPCGWMPGHNEIKTGTWREWHKCICGWKGGQATAALITSSAEEDIPPGGKDQRGHNPERERESVGGVDGREEKSWRTLVLWCTLHSNVHRNIDMAFLTTYKALLHWSNFWTRWTWTSKSSRWIRAFLLVTSLIAPLLFSKFF